MSMLTLEQYKREGILNRVDAVNRGSGFSDADGQGSPEAIGTGLLLLVTVSMR